MFIYVRQPDDSSVWLLKGKELNKMNYLQKFGKQTKPLPDCVLLLLASLPMKEIQEKLLRYENTLS